jgi:hypothetical protein
MKKNNLNQKKPIAVKNNVSLIIMFSIFWSPLSFSLGCDHLDSAQKIQDFVRQSQQSNPFLRDQLSTWISVSPCQGSACDKANKKQRKKQKEKFHLLHLDENKRIRSFYGIHKNQCVIHRGERSYLCQACSKNTNSECRSFASADSDNRRIQGTNIDLDDFSLLERPEQVSTCTEFPSKKDIFKITTQLKSEGSKFDKVITYYNKAKKTPVLLNFYKAGILRKVYRFFPKSYLQIGDEWVASAIRVRSTSGSEKKYDFETQVRILKNKNKQPQIFLNANVDPALKGQEIELLFNTQ